MADNALARMMRRWHFARMGSDVGPQDPSAEERTCPSLGTHLYAHPSGGPHAPAEAQGSAQG